MARISLARTFYRLIITCRHLCEWTCANANVNESSAAARTLERSVFSSNSAIVFACATVQSDAAVQMHNSRKWLCLDTVRYTIVAQLPHRLHAIVRVPIGNLCVCSDLRHKFCFLDERERERDDRAHSEAVRRPHRLRAIVWSARSLARSIRPVRLSPDTSDRPTDRPTGAGKSFTGCSVRQWRFCPIALTGK